MKTCRSGLHQYEGSRCPDCARTQSRKWYQEHRDYDKQRHAKRRALIDFYKNKPCVSCGYYFPPAAMDFHHRDPTTKLFHIGRNSSRPLPVLLAEIRKCDVICSNCHRILEYTSKDKA